MSSKTIAIVAALAVAASGFGQITQTPPAKPGGVVPLPQGPPPPGTPAVVPHAVKPLPDADHPLGWSPDFSAIDAYIAKGPVTMDEAIAIALYTNRQFGTAVASLEAARAQAGLANANMNPTLSVNGQITEFDAPTTASLGALVDPKNPSAVPPFLIVAEFNPVFTASLTLPIDVWGTLKSAASAAQFNEMAARLDLSRVRNDVVYQVKSAFFNVLRAEAQAAVATDNLNNALHRLEDANKNFAAGTNARFDVLTAQRDVSDAQQALISARAQVTVNLAMLKNTMGVSVRGRMSISSDGALTNPPGVEPVPAPGQPSDGAPAPTDPGGAIVPLTPPSLKQVDDDFDFGPDFAGLLTEAEKNRPEIQQAEAQVTAGKKGLQYSRRSQYPSFTLSASDVYTPYAAGFSRINEGVFTLGVNVPIYDGGVGREAERAQRAVISLAEVNKRNAVDQVQLDVTQAYIGLAQARQRVAVTEVELAQAKESFRVSRVRYQAGVSQQTGVSPQLELSNAQTSLAQAQTNEVNALYDYNTSLALLDRAVGRFGKKPGDKPVK